MSFKGSFGSCSSVELSGSIPVHSLGGVSHSSTSLANINSLITDADLQSISTADSKYVDVTGDTMSGDLGVNGNLTVTGQGTLETIQLGITPSISGHSEGMMYWDENAKTLSVMTDVDGTVLQVGQEQFIKVVNKTGSTITNGLAVFINGAQGNRPTIDLADVTSDETAHKVIGIVTADITNNGEGYVTTTGLVRGLNTNDFNEGEELYIDPSNAGHFINTRPTSPQHAVKIGYVVTKATSPTSFNGVILVNVYNGSDLSKLHDVLLSNVQDKDILTYSQSLSAWNNSEDISVNDMTVRGDIIVEGLSGSGILINGVGLDYGWRDLEGLIRPDPAGGNSPTLTAFRSGAVREYSYADDDELDMSFHLPHDYAVGTDMFIHVHWAHNGTTISGNFQYTISYTYAKGHNQDEFIAEKSQQVTYNTVDIATTPQYRHRVDEIQLSDSGGTGNYLNSNDIEVDGIVLANFTVDAVPTIGGGDDPFVFTVDIHYQSTGLPTKNKSPNFYN